ncbi:hypothetical protein ACFRI7_08860 [Streptomyces sp. NPDC056716]|uniref:hypothetical protein n=1 Tax=unclassified Streptomyces TaxID=2593676 RepID=UPI0036BF564F
MSAPRTAPAAPSTPAPSSPSLASGGAAGASRRAPAPQDPSPAPRTPPPAAPGAAADPAGDVVRWAVFSCTLVPLVLLWYGTSLAGAAGTALGLAAVTGACRVLLRRSERRARATAGEEPSPSLPRHPGKEPSPSPHRHPVEGPPPPARQAGAGRGTAPGAAGNPPHAWETPRHPGGNGLSG